MLSSWIPGLISSGSLLIAAPPEIPIVEAAAQVGVKAYPVGRITSEDKPMLIEPLPGRAVSSRCRRKMSCGGS